VKRCSSYVVAGLCLSLAACNQTPVCGAKPSKPKVVRTAAFFGRVSSDPQRWARAQIGEVGVADARLVIGGRTITTDARTERLGYCDPAFKRERCAAFVGLRRPGVASWILLAQPQRPPQVIPAQSGRLEVVGTMLWSVQTSSIVLSQGVELRFGSPFAQRLKKLGLRLGHVGRQVDPRLYIDPKSGELLDVGFAGCM
jgi:hypothetical protein